MLKNLRFLRSVIRDYGLSWVLRRGFYEFQLRSGIHRLRFPQREWDHNELARWVKSGVPTAPEAFFERWKKERRKFLFEPRDRDRYQKLLPEILGDEGMKRLVAEAEGIGNGEFIYFFKHKAMLGFPPDWHLNPFAGGRSDPNTHWTRLPMFSHDYGDMKFVWEPGRFASAFTLARAYWATGRDFAETYWVLVESWKAANPPNKGAHWKCGQETSLRLMAWYFALHAFLESSATTPERFAMLAGMAAAQADRVERDHVYAHLQRNNHAMSEGLGLYVTGLLFPQFDRAAHWRERGLDILEEEGIALIKPEGTFRQKSHNYHRLMLHLYLYAGRLAELNGDRFSETLTQRLRNAADYLYQVQDPDSGRVPNFGANDGALIFPVNSCDYTDYRPACAASHCFFHRKRIYRHGPWDEDLLWLYGSDALEAPEEPPERVDLAKLEGGIYTLRGKESWAFTHCESFKERPGQPDALHLDLWWRGINLTLDPGSYLYFCQPPWKGGFGRTQSHCTVSVDGFGQMEKGPNFMATNWHRARVNSIDTSGKRGIKHWEGEHDGYARLEDPVIHRRAVVKVSDEDWIVIDDLLGKASHEIALHWLLPDFPYRVDGRQIVLSTPKGEYSLLMDLNYPENNKSPMDLARGGEASAPLGWVSHYYGDKQPAVSLRRSYKGRLPCRFITVFSPVGKTSGLLKTQSGGLSVEVESCSLELDQPGSSPIVARVNNAINEKIDSDVSVRSK